MRIWAALLALLVPTVSSRAADDPAVPVTFAEHIAPLVFENCTGCHQPGLAAPFSLLTYVDTRKHAKTMLRVMEARYMPPWQPEAGGPPLRGERRLTEDQIALFGKWVKTGMAEGDPKKVPSAPRLRDGWRLGKPDLVVKMDRSFEVPADGPDIYQNFVLPLGVKEDRWVTAVEFQSSAPEVVHHVLYHLDDSGRARARAAKEGQPGFPGMGFRPTGSLGGWAVGASPLRLPDGMAWPLRKGSDLVLQTHFHPTGKSAKETLTVGIYFADKPPQRTLVNLPLPPAFGLFSNIDIPAGKTGFTIADSFTLPADVELIGVGAHAHYLGKTMTAAATLPDGSKKKLFGIGDWDFNWQGQYLYKDAVRLPKGTVIRAAITWDNSVGNPRNPTQPPVRIRWGEESRDEMGQVNFLMVAANEADRSKLQDGVRAHLRETVIRSRSRGDEINWGKLGIDPPAFWKLAPAKPKEKEPAKPPLTFRDLDGKEHTPLAVNGAKAHVLLFLATDCPISNGYSPEIATLIQVFTDRGVRFYVVHADPDLTPAKARKHAKDYGLTPPVLLDARQQLVAAVGATRTPEVAVILPDGELAYRGRIDDRYPALGKKRMAPSRRDLCDALEAIVNGKEVAIPRTEAVGCSIPDPPAQDK